MEQRVIPIWFRGSVRQEGSGCEELVLVVIEVTVHRPTEERIPNAPTVRAIRSFEERSPRLFWAAGVESPVTRRQRSVAA
jgi:hypothetical protein